MRRLRKVLAALATVTCLAMTFVPSVALADDIELLDDDVVVTYPQQQTGPLPRRAPARAQSSPIGKWVEVKRSEGSTAIQTCAYYIHPNANLEGTIQVDIKTEIYCKNGSAWWTTTKTIYDNGTQCAHIGPDWNSKAYKGDTISQKASFAVRGGGSHHITSVENIFRDSAGTVAGWDFYINIPYRISAEASEGGSISPEGHSLVSAGDSKEYTIAPSPGWRIKDVLVDGESVGARDTYTFSNVTGDHTISAKFQKIWTVTFVDGVTGDKLGEETVDEGSGATSPEAPSHEGWHFDGWSEDFSSVGKDMTVTATYSPTIAVRVPSLLPCRILSDGTVAVPGGYVIENLSVVDVRASQIETTGTPGDASWQLSDAGEVIHSWDGGDKPGATLEIARQGSKELALSISNVSGAGEWRQRAQEAATGPVEFCSISYTFKRAS